MNENNKKIDKKQAKRNYFTLNVRKEANQRIEELENLFGAKLTEEEKKGLVHDAAKRVSKRIALISAVGLLTFGTINLFENNKDRLLNSGNPVVEEAAHIEGIDDKNEETIQAKETEVEKFRNQLQDFSNYNSQIKSNVEQEVAKVKDSKEGAIEYLKQLYASEYNKNNVEKISEDNIKIWKRNSRLYGTALYEDKAENGDTIIRECWEKDLEESKIIKGASVISVSIKTNDGSKEEAITYYNGEYVPIYNKNEKVKEQGSNTLCKMGEVIDKGIIWASSIGEGQYDIKMQVAISDKQKDFEKAVTNYRDGRTNNQYSKNDLDSQEER